MPNVKHLRAFGCASYPLIMNERKKLDPVAKRCVLVGYGTEVKGYWLYDPSHCGKVLYSRDVKFNEMEFGIEETKTAKSDCVELDVSPSTPEVQEEEQGQNMEIDEITTADKNVGNK